MFMVYLDESGSPYRDYKTYCDGYEAKVPAAAGGPMPSYPFFVLAAVGIAESHLPMVEEWFGDMKRRFLQNVSSDASQEYEIKGEILYALREGRQPTSWLGTRSKKRKRLLTTQKAVWDSLTAGVLRDLEMSIFDLCRRLRPVVWTVVVKQRHVFRRHRSQTWCPYYWALTYPQQRVSLYVQATYGAYQRAVFVTDETSTLTTAAQSDDYLATRRTINSTAAWPVEFARYLIDVPLFAKSHLHQPLQISDLVAHAIMRHIKNEDSLGWFDKVEPFLAQHWNGMGHENAGLTFIQ
jgi:hypothetical protein